MARASTALSAVRFAVESSLGASASSPTWFYPWCRAEDITPERPALQPRFLTNDRFLRPAVPGEHSAAGRVSMEVGPENFHKFLYALLPSIATSAAPEAGTSQNTFTAGTTQVTFEMQAEKGYDEIWNRGGWINSASFGVDRNSILTCDLDFRFQQQAGLTADTFPASPTYSALDPFTDMKGVMERDDGSVTDMDGFTLTINTGVLDFKSFGDPYVSDIVVGKQDITWELACAFTDDTEFRRFLGDDTGSGHQRVADRYDPVKIEWEFKTGQFPTSVFPYSLKFTAWAGLYTVFPQGIGSDSEILRSRPTVLVRYDSSNSADLSVILHNTIGPATVVL